MIFSWMYLSFVNACRWLRMQSKGDVTNIKDTIPLSLSIQQVHFCQSIKNSQFASFIKREKADLARGNIRKPFEILFIFLIRINETFEQQMTGSQCVLYEFQLVYFFCVTANYVFWFPFSCYKVFFSVIRCC